LVAPLLQVISTRWVHRGGLTLITPSFHVALVRVSKEETGGEKLLYAKTLGVGSGVGRRDWRGGRGGGGLEGGQDGGRRGRGGRDGRLGGVSMCVVW